MRALHANNRINTIDPRFTLSNSIFHNNTFSGYSSVQSYDVRVGLVSDALYFMYNIQMKCT